MSKQQHRLSVSAEPADLDALEHGEELTGQNTANKAIWATVRDYPKATARLAWAEAPLADRGPPLERFDRASAERQRRESNLRDLFASAHRGDWRNVA